MTAEKLELRKRIDELLMACNQNSPPVDLHLIAKHCRVKDITELAGSKESPEGLLIPTENGFMVKIRPNLPHARRRSTLAHEIAHTFFYDDSIHFPRKGPKWFRHAWGEEGVCSEIARQILVPRFMLDASLASLGNMPITMEILRRLADGFEVSTDIIVRRLQDENLCDAVFIFVRFESSAQPRPQRPMFTSGSLRVKGVCAFILGQSRFLEALQQSASFGSSQCELEHHSIGRLSVACQRINVEPLRVLALATLNDESTDRVRTPSPSVSLVR